MPVPAVNQSVRLVVSTLVGVVPSIDSVRHG